MNHRFFLKTALTSVVASLSVSCVVENRPAVRASEPAVGFPAPGPAIAASTHNRGRPVQPLFAVATPKGVFVQLTPEPVSIDGDGRLEIVLLKEVLTSRRHLIRLAPNKPIILQDTSHPYSDCPC